MNKMNAAQAATDTLALNSEAAFNVKWLMEKRVDVMLDLYADRGEWSGDYDSTAELASLVVAIDAIEDAEGEVADDRQLVDIELPSGATFTSYLATDLAAELQKCLDRLKTESIDDANRRRAVALADLAEAQARAADPKADALKRLRAIDAAKGQTGVVCKFDIDPDGSYDLESIAGIVDAVIALDDIALRVPDDQSKVVTAVRTGIWELLK